MMYFLPNDDLKILVINFIENGTRRQRLLAAQREFSGGFRWVNETFRKVLLIKFT